jgi:hypothetical protein
VPDKSEPCRERSALGIVWLGIVLRAEVEGVPLEDHRVMWMLDQAMVCVSEGMPPWEAVQLAGDLAFRQYGLPSPSIKMPRPPVG